jgi:Skp family chaperone for outer membrane proteins
VSRWLALGLLLLSAATQADGAKVLVVDLGEAYTRSTALAGLLREVEDRLNAAAARHRTETAALREQLDSLRKSAPEERGEQLRLARQISALEAAALAVEERLALSNQQAIEQVNAAIGQIKQALAQEHQALAVLDINDTLWVRPDCKCLVTDELYERLNAALPVVSLGFTE